MRQNSSRHFFMETISDIHTNSDNRKGRQNYPASFKLHLAIKTV